MRTFCAILLGLLVALTGCTGTYYKFKHESAKGRVIAIEVGENRVPVADAICAVKQDPNTCDDSQE